MNSTTSLPAPAGEPEMPEPAYRLKWERSDVFTAEQLRAYGDARAEHARRVAYPLADALQALVEDSQHANHADCEDGGYCPVRDARLALAEFDAIRAAAPPQGEQTCSTKRV